MHCAFILLYFEIDAEYAFPFLMLLTDIGQRLLNSQITNAYFVYNLVEYALFYCVRCPVSRPKQKKSCVSTIECPIGLVVETNYTVAEPEESEMKRQWRGNWKRRMDTMAFLFLAINESIRIWKIKVCTLFLLFISYQSK